jgi:hypothetical protein
LLSTGGMVFGAICANGCLDLQWDYCCAFCLSFISVLVHRFKVEDSCLVEAREVGSRLEGLLLDQGGILSYRTSFRGGKMDGGV